MRQASVYRKGTLSVNGKKARIKLDDFLKASATMGIDERVTIGLIDSMHKAMPAWVELIGDSFLSDDMKQAYIELLGRRMAMLTGK